jgi:hypothetical protein
MEMSGQLHTPAALHPGKVPLFSIGYEAGWTPKLVSMLRWQEKYLPYWESNYSHPDHSLVIMLTKLSQLSDVTKPYKN